MKQVIDFIKKHNMINTQDCVIAGVSGGADSLCLLFVLLELKEKVDFRIEVVHIEHGIRGAESLEDALYVRKLCEGIGVPFHLYSYDVPQLAKEKKLSLEETARECRYEAFETVLKKCGGTKIAVAHNEDDQAETILWNLSRGSGIRGLCGMRPIKGRIIRPLLQTSREKIEEYLLEHQVIWRTDSTNLGLDYTRNKLRHQVLPLLKEELNSCAVGHIAAAGERLLKAELYLEKISAKRASEIGEIKEARVWMKRKELLQEEEIMQEYILRSWMEQLGMGLRDIGAAHIKQVRKLAAGRSGKETMLPGGWSCKCTGDFLVLGKTPKAQSAQECKELAIPGETRFGKWQITTELLPFQNQNIPEKKYTKWLDYDTITDTVHLRNRRPGDYFDTAAGRKKLKKYFIDEKILQEERARIPLVTEGEHVLWSVGYRISEKYKVTKDTKILLKIQVTEELL